MKAIDLEALKIGLALLTVLAVVTMQVTKQIARHFPRYTAHVATVVGLVVALLLGVGLFETLGLPVQVRVRVVDEILTGILLAGGAGAFTAVTRWMEGKGEPEAGVKTKQTA